MTQSTELHHLQNDQQKVELKIQKEIRRNEDFLVLWIQDALDKKTSYGDLEESQFRNLVRVADTTDSPEVVKNFLRYQVGRDKKWGRGKDSLAERIVLDIGSGGRGKGIGVSPSDRKIHNIHRYKKNLDGIDSALLRVWS